MENNFLIIAQQYSTVTVQSVKNEKGTMRNTMRILDEINACIYEYTLEISS